ncbi:MAG TPA: beta-ketoacyl-ACP synthase 3 [Solirubrobacteraceae bacterium]
MLEGNGSTPELRAALRRQDLPPVQPAVVSVGTAIPPGRLTNAELAERLGISEEWIVSRTGVHERPIAGPDDRLTDYAARAGAQALERAGMDPADVDLVIVATLTQDEIQPNAAPQVAYELGANGAGAVDVGAACTAFLSGVSLAASQIESHRVRNVLVIGADFVISRVANWDDKRSLPLFGDGAGAVLMTPATGQYGAVGPIVLGSDGSHAKTILVERDTPLYMDGPEVYRHAVARMAESTIAAVEQAGLTLDDIDLFVYHQANARITRALGDRLGLNPEKVVDVIAHLGNSSAATLPLALAEAERDGRLKPGARVHLGAFGAGFTWGGGVIEWGGGGSDD